MEAPTGVPPRRDRADVRGAIPLALTVSGAVATVAAAYIAVVEHDPALLADQGSVYWLTLGAVAAAVTAVAGAWGVRELPPIAGWGLALATTGTTVPLWAAWSIWPAWLRADGLAIEPLAVLGVTLVALRGRTLRDAARRRALWATAVLSIAAVVMHLAGYNPFDDLGCTPICLDVKPLGDGWLTPGQGLARSCLLGCAAVLTATYTLARGAGLPRTPRSLNLATACSLTCGATSLVWRWLAWQAGAQFTGALLLPAAGVGAVSTAACILAVRTSRTRAAVRTLAEKLSDPNSQSDPEPRRIRDAHFAFPGGQRWVDSIGGDVDEDLERIPHVTLTDHNGPAVRLLLAARADPADVVTSMTPATRLMLANAQLAALVRAQLNDVRRSQRSIVAIGDAERTRIERDLHDGIQQQVVGTSFHLRAIAAEADPVTARHLIQAEAHLRTALAHLRGLAQETFPDVLFEDGLAAALRELSATAAVPLTYEVHIPPELPAQVAAAAYAMITTAVTALGGHTSPVHVSVSAVDANLTVEVQADTAGSPAAPPDFTDVADRIGAIGGTLAERPRGDHLAAQAVIPLDEGTLAGGATAGTAASRASDFKNR